MHRMFRRYVLSKIISYPLLCYLACVPLLCMAAGQCPSYRGAMNGTRGRISSYMYPQNYLNNCIEKWSIEAPEGSVVTISFTDIDLEIGDDYTCNRDFLQIANTFAIENFCKYNGTKVYISRGKVVWLTFRTNKDTTKRGFDLLYITGQVPSTSCKADEFHCDNGKCIYDFWKCNKQDECGDGSDEIDCPSVVHCGEKEIMCISQVTSKPTCLHSVFRCDGKQDCIDNEDEDMTRCAEINCVFNQNDWTGVVTSPKYPLNYPAELDCEWIIHLPDTKATVQLRFIDFDLQVNTGTDYVVVYDGANSEQNILGQFSHSNEPPALIQSSGNRMLVVFHSDSTLSEKGFNATYQGKGYCLSDQGMCGAGEFDCYKSAKKCDGVWDCVKFGGDERACGKCGFDQFRCGLESSQCYHVADHCNGVGYCSNNADELHCSPIQCGSHNGTFLCDNGRCIYETWKCDRTNDCEDYSDERDCSGSTNLVIIAAVAGSLICALLLVVALGCTCKLYALRLNDQQGGPRHETPMSRLQAHLMRRRAPPPYHEAMLTSRSYDEVHPNLMNSAHGRRSRRSASLTPNVAHASDEVAPHSQGTPAGTATGRSPDEGGTTTSNHGVPDQPSPTLPLLLSSDSGDDMGSDMEANPSANNGVHISISQATGISAQWRQPICHKNNSSSSITDSDVQNSKPVNSCIENVSASGDNVTKDGDEKDLSGATTPSILGLQESLNSSVPSGGELQRIGSQESLNSVGSGLSTGSQTQLLNP